MVESAISKEGRAVRGAIWLTPVASILGILACTVLLATEVLDRLPLCGGSTGCMAASLDTWSHVLGLPVALFGLVYFLVCGWRATSAFRAGRGSTVFETCLFFLGFCVSMAFAWRELRHLHSICWWCSLVWFASAIQLACAIISLNKAVGIFPTGATRSLKLLGLVCLGVGVLATAMARSRNDVTRLSSSTLASVSSEELIPTSAPRLTNANPHGHLIAFLDFSCPTCQSLYPKLRRYCSLSGHPDLVIRLHCVNEHDLSRMYAAAALLANTKGSFFSFADHAFATEQTINDLRSQLNLIGVSAEENAAIMETLKGPMYARLDKEEAFCTRLGVKQTPTVVLLGSDGARKPLLLTEVLTLVQH